MEGTSKVFGYFVLNIYPHIEDKSKALIKTVFDYKKGQITEQRMRTVLEEHNFTLRQDAMWNLP